MKAVQTLLPEVSMTWRDGTPCNSPTREKPTVFDTKACCGMNDGSSVEVNLPKPLPPILKTPSQLNVLFRVVEGDTEHSDVEVIPVPPMHQVLGVTLESKSDNSYFVVIAEEQFEGHPYTKKIDILCEDLIAEARCKTSAANKRR